MNRNHDEYLYTNVHLLVVRPEKVSLSRSKGRKRAYVCKVVEGIRSQRGSELILYSDRKLESDVIYDFSHLDLDQISTGYHLGYAYDVSDFIDYSYKNGDRTDGFKGVFQLSQENELDGCILLMHSFSLASDVQGKRALKGRIISPTRVGLNGHDVIVYTDRPVYQLGQENFVALTYKGIGADGTSLVMVDEEEYPDPRTFFSDRQGATGIVHDGRGPKVP